MKLPGLEEIQSIVKEIPAATEAIIGHLERIETLLEKLVRIQENRDEK